MKELLLAYDGFSHSDNALATAAELGGSYHRDHMILSVVPPDARGSKSGGHVGLRPHSSEDVAKARLPPSRGSSRRCGWSTASR